MITEIEECFTKGCGRCARFETPDCSVHLWSEGVNALRQICLEAGLTETVKWGHPCYVIDGRNIAIIGAFRDTYRLTFFNAALMKDPENILQKRGPNTRNADMIVMTENGDAARLAPVIRAYLEEAIGYAKKGITAPKTVVELDLPEELVAAMDSDPELAEAFNALTPGRQRSYVLNLNSAKATATRINRIAKFRDKIIAGKGATER